MASLDARSSDSKVAQTSVFEVCGLSTMNQEKAADLGQQVRATCYPLSEVLAEARGVKKTHATVSAGGKIVQVIEPVIMALT